MYQICLPGKQGPVGLIEVSGCAFTAVLPAREIRPAEPDRSARGHALTQIRDTRCIRSSHSVARCAGDIAPLRPLLVFP